MIYKNINLIEEISNILDKEVKFDFVKDRLGHDKKYRLSSLKLLNYYERKGVEYKPTEITEWFKGFLIKE